MFGRGSGPEDRHGDSILLLSFFAVCVCRCLMSVRNVSVSGWKRVLTVESFLVYSQLAKGHSSAGATPR